MQIISSTEHHPLIAMAALGPVALARGDEELAYVLSRKDYERIHSGNIAAFQKICAEIGAQARARGLNDDILNSLLADES